MQLLRDARVEGEHPEAEGELVLDLEVDPPRQHGDDRVDAVKVDEGQPEGGGRSARWRIQEKLTYIRTLYKYPTSATEGEFKQR